MSSPDQPGTAGTLADLDVPGPTPTAETERFWAALAQDRFELPWCPGCERWFFYPRAMCPRCWETAWQWRAASGRARVRGFSVVHKPGHPGWAPAVPYVLAIAELAEGPRMLTLVVAGSDVVRVGLPVRVRPTRVGDHRVVGVVPETDPGEEDS